MKKYQINWKKGYLAFSLESLKSYIMGEKNLRDIGEIIVPQILFS